MAVTFTLLDLQHLLAQIQMAETNQLPVSPHLAFGLRQVQGTLNNTVPGNQNFGAADQPFALATSQFFRTVTVNVDGTIFDSAPLIDGTTITNTYAINNPNAPTALSRGTVIDTGPRTVSNLISDISINNPAALATAQAFGAQLGNGYSVMAANPGGLTLPGADGVFGTADDVLPKDTNNLFIGNVTPDAGLSAPFNSWMTYFGQFFDHGLDLITKGGSGTVMIPLLPDDPLVTLGPDGIANTGDEVSLFGPTPAVMFLSRASTSVISGGADGWIGDNLATVGINEAADDVHRFTNTTTPFVDQNQTYSSHPSHQVFLREYVVGVDTVLHSTGSLLRPASGQNGMATWADLKANALKLGIILTDLNVGNVPLLQTDAYGNFIHGASGGAIVVINTGTVAVPVYASVEMNPAIPAALPGNTVFINHAFLNDIAAAASPVSATTRLALAADSDTVAGPLPNPLFNPLNPVGPGNLKFLPQPAGTYDNELLDAHYIAGDGRVNENVGLTAVHEIFHSEHNRIVDLTKALIQSAVDSGNSAFAADWVINPAVLGVVNGIGPLGNPTHIIAASEWNGERIFQTAKFGTETQYQHLVFEEFARKVAPTIHLFGNNDIHLDPAITSEFANAVYRFGHSMLDESVPIYTLDANGAPVIDMLKFRDMTTTPDIVDLASLTHIYIDGALVPLTGSVAFGPVWETFMGTGFGDTMVGNNGNDQFIGGAGDDDITGGSDNDNYFYNSTTDGNDLITELGSFDTIILTGGETLANISLQRSFSDLTINFRGGSSVLGGNSLTVTNFFGSQQSQVEQIIFQGTGSYIDLSDPLLQQQLSFNNPILPSLAVQANTNFGQAQMTTMGLIEAFTNPLGYAGLGPNAANAIVQGTTHQIGSEIDEFVTGALRNNLLGLPLDLAALNIARGRETGVAPLNLVRAQIFAGTVDMTMKPYESWYEYGLFLKHAASLVNFVAAYGTHASITGATTTFDKRAAAADLVGLGIDAASALQPVGSFAHDAYDFMHSINAYAANVLSPIAVHAQWSTGNVTGLDNVDLWIGGLAEKQNLFGGLLGSTFNFIFETQLETLQDADRLYYLPRIEGMDFGAQVEGNTFASLIIGATGAKHIPAAIFMTPEYTVEAGLVTFNQNTWLKNPVTGAFLVEKLPDGTVHFIGDNNFFGNTIVLGGTEGNDRLVSGHADDDTVWGDGGNDFIDGGNGNDNLFGGTGNDTFQDSAGSDIIHGDSGDDVIFSGIGDDTIFGGDGNDYINTGSSALGDAALGGAGNDILIGGDGGDELIGNEGDDWLDGGANGDGLVGDTGAPTGQVPLFAGNDVLDGGMNGDKMTGFSGDDIMLGQGGFDKFLGKLGFDWASFDKEFQGVSVDMERREFIPNQAQLAGDAVRDFFVETEATSGSKFNDLIQGTENAGRAAAIFNELQNVNLITNLNTFFVGGQATDWDATGANIASPTGFTMGNILLGGGGSDMISGRAGNDIIDGDAFLRVSLDVNKNIIREILTDTTPRNIDTAVYRGNIADYTINLTPDAAGFITITHNSVIAIGGGVVPVRFVSDGTDKVRNVERLQFADVTVNIDASPNADLPPTGNPFITGNTVATPIVATVGTTLSVVDPATELAILASPISGLLLRDPDNATLANPTGVIYTGVDPDGIGGPATAPSFQWQELVFAAPGGGSAWLDINGATGVTYMPQNFNLGLQLRVVATYVDMKGIVEQVASAPAAVTQPNLNLNTAPFVNQQLSPPGLPDTAANTANPFNLFLPLNLVFGDNETAVGRLTFTASVTLPGGGTEVLSDGGPAGALSGLKLTIVRDAGLLVTGATLTGNLTIPRSLSVTVSATDEGTPNLLVPGTFLPGTRLTVTDTFLINVQVGNVAPVLGVAEVVFSGTESTLFFGALSSHPVDPDGPSPVVYQLIAGSVVNGTVVIDPVTGTYQFNPTFGLSSNDVPGPAPTFSFQYRLFDGSSFSATRTVNGVVQAVNDGVAVIRITGTAATGGTLTAVIGENVLLFGMGNDPDGLVQAGSESYQWVRDGLDIVGATGANFVLADTDVGHRFAARVTYTDGQNFVNTAISDAALPIGEVLTNGVAAKPASLQRTVTGDLATFWDPDNGVQNGTASFTFEITNNGGATWTSVATNPDGLTALLSAAPTVGPNNFVRANVVYIDGLGNVNSVMGAAVHYFVDAVGGNVLVGTAARDLIFGNGGADTITGGNGDDFAQGGGGSDVFRGLAGDGNDTYDGGNGAHDLYDLSATIGVASVSLGNILANADPLSIIGTATSDAGTDFLYNIEDVIGSQGANVIIGNEVGNILSGLGGNDRLETGSGGNDQLIGGTGDDTYVVNSSGIVTLTEVAGQGNDMALSSVTLDLGASGAQVEDLILTGGSSINGTGNALANFITGNDAANTLSGGSGGADTLAGGLGDDVYNINHDGITLIEKVGEGTDMVVTLTGTAATSFTLGANFENLTMTSGSVVTGIGNELANHIIALGAIVANTLDSGSAAGGGAAFDILDGGTGNDTYIVRHGNVTVTEAVAAGTDLVQSFATFTLGTNVENLTLQLGAGNIDGTGNTLANVIIGNDGDNILSSGVDTVNDTLNGGAGNDRLVAQGTTGVDVLDGGSGNDVYVVNRTTNTISDSTGQGTDTVESSVTFVLAAVTAALEIENLTLTDGITVGGGTAAIDGTGNTLANIIIGNDGANILNGGADTVADTIFGGGGNDTIQWAIGGGADVIDGGGGSDTLAVTATGAADTLTVTLTGASLTNVTGGAFSNVESVTVNLGTAAADNNDTLSYGSSGSAATVNLTAGSATGFASILGIDNVTGGSGNDTIAGNAAVNTLNGGAGDDTINWTIGQGADNIDGGTGVLDRLVITGSALVSDTLNVILTGTALTSVTGGTLAGIEQITLDMLGQAAGVGDRLSYGASTGNATIVLSTSGVAGAVGSASGFQSIQGVESATGGAGNDTISGDSGNNTLIGGAGTDTLSYANATAGVSVSLSITVAQATVGAGSDTVSQFENLTGSAFNDTLSGSNGVNVLNGGLGVDTLSYANSTASVTVNMATGTSAGFGADTFSNFENLTGSNQADNLTGDANVNSINGAGGADTMTGGGGADIIDTGAADDNVTDIIRFTATGDYGDTVNNLDATGSAANVDHIRFSGALLTAFDDVTVNNVIAFVSGNNGGGQVTTDLTTAEALMLLSGEGVATLDLTSASVVAAAFNAEFILSGADGLDALLVINDSTAASNDAAMWQWVQAAGGTAGVDAGELTFIGLLHANAEVTTANFDFGP